MFHPRKYILLFIFVNLVSNDLVLNTISTKNFTFLFEVIVKHFDKNLETTIYYSEELNFIPDLIRQMSLNGHYVYIYTLNTITAESRQTASHNALLLSTNLSIEHKNYFQPKDNIIFFLDLTENNGDFACNIKDRLENMTYYDCWSYFRSLFVVKFSACDPNEQIWICKPWFNQFQLWNKPLHKVYFNKKPNLHQSNLDIQFHINYIFDNLTNKEIEIRNVILEKWNASYGPSSIILFIANEPIFTNNYSDAYHVKPMCFVVPKSSLKPAFNIIPKCLHWTVWSGIFFTMSACIIVWYNLNCTKKQNNFNLLLLFQSFEFIYKLYISEPNLKTTRIKRFPLRVIISCIILTSIVLISGQNIINK